MILFNSCKDPGIGRKKDRQGTYRLCVGGLPGVQFLSASLTCTKISTVFMSILKRKENMFFTVQENSPKVTNRIACFNLPESKGDHTILGKFSSFCKEPFPPLL